MVSAQGSDAVARAARVHGLRARHRAPPVRLDAYVRLSALDPEPLGLGRLADAIESDPQVSADPALGPELVAAARVLDAFGVSAHARSAAVACAQRPEIRSEAFDASRYAGVAERGRAGRRRSAGRTER